MLKRTITAAETYGPCTEIMPEERKRIRSTLPGKSARRLSEGSLAISAAMAEAIIGPEDDLVFASTLGGTHSLETYLASFPNPSPASFQSSVHAGVVEAVLVARKQSLRRLQSIGNSPETLVPIALRTALLSDAKVVHLVLAEERGDWLIEHELCGASTFACYLRLSRTMDAPALGTLALEISPSDMSSTPAQAPLLTDAFCQQISQRAPLLIGGPTFGTYSLKWE